MSSSNSRKPFPEQVPPQLSEQSIAQFMLELPLLDEDRLSPAQIACAANIRSQFALSLSNAQACVRAMRNSWIAWHALPIISSKITSKSAATAPVFSTTAQASELKSSAAHTHTSAAAALQDGSRVRIAGLQARPQLNGRTGVVCGAFDHESGRWTVEIDASDAEPVFQISIRTANITLLPESPGSTAAKHVHQPISDSSTQICSLKTKLFDMDHQPLMNMFQSVPVATMLGAATLQIVASVFESNDSLRSFANLDEKTLSSIVEASCLELTRELCQQTQKLHRAYDIIDANAKLKADSGASKFSGTTLIVGCVDDFHNSLHGRLGQGPSLDFERAMRAEHCERADSHDTFTTSNYNLSTNPALEWSYAVDGAKAPHEQLLDKEGREVRKIRSINELMKLDIVKKAGLHRAEVISVSLYTGPMFMKYNPCLRQGASEGRNMFATTIFVLVSAVQKIARVTEISEQLVLYCGLGNVSDLPKSFWHPDKFGSRGWTEFGFRSTTADKSVALDYSGIKKGNPHPMVIAIRPNSIDRGACIADLSQYEGEKEFLFVPCSFLQPDGPPALEVVAEGIVNVIPVHLSVNLRTETLGELVEKKKRLHLASAVAIVEEVRHELEQWATSPEAAARLRRDPWHGDYTAASLAAKIVEECNSVVKRQREAAAEDFVDDGMFRGLVSEVLDTKTWAKEKKELWMQDAHRFISEVWHWSLRHSHRMWQSFLRRCNTSNVSRGMPVDASSSLQLLKSRGLVKREARHEKNADHEAVMVQAGADGWTAADIDAAAAAGASVNDTDMYGSNGVFLAAQYGYLDSMTALIKANTNIDKCRSDGVSPIFIAAYYGYSECTKQLISSRCDVNKCRDGGASPIWTAAEHGHADIIAQIVSAKGDVNKCNDSGEAPIFVAARIGYADVVALLLASRAEPRGSHKGPSALDVAMKNGHAECVRLLKAALQ
jgi:hypothetical protein